MFNKNDLYANIRRRTGRICYLVYGLSLLTYIYKRVKKCSIVQGVQKYKGLEGVQCTYVLSYRWHTL